MKFIRHNLKLLTFNKFFFFVIKLKDKSTFHVATMLLYSPQKFVLNRTRIFFKDLLSTTQT